MVTDTMATLAHELLSGSPAIVLLCSPLPLALHPNTHTNNTAHTRVSRAAHPWLSMRTCLVPDFVT